MSARTFQTKSRRQNDGMTASYFGLHVTILLTLDQCSLIRYGNREFIVHTQDLRKMNLARVAA